MEIHRKFTFICITIVLLCTGISQVTVAQIPRSDTRSNLPEEQDFRFAVGLFNEGMYRLAAQQFDSFISAYPNSLRRTDAHFMLGESYLALQRYLDARQSFQTLVRENPASPLVPDAYHRIGMTFFREGKKSRSTEWFKKVLDEFPRHSLASECAYWIGEAYISADEKDLAVKYLQLSVEGFPANRLADYAWFSLGWVHQSERRFQKAVAFYDSVNQRIPPSSLAPLARIRAAECLFEEGKFEQVIERTARVDTSGVDSTLPGTALFLRAESFAKLEKYLTALGVYDSLFVSYPKHTLISDAHYGKGWVLLSLNRYEQAAVEFDKCAVLGGERSSAALYRKGVALRLAGKTFDAEEAFRQSTGEFADDALYQLASMSAESKEWVRADSLLEQLVTRYPSSRLLAESRILKGEIQLIRSRFDSAATEFATAIRALPSGSPLAPTALFKLGIALFRLEKFDSSASTFGTLIKRYPSDSLIAETRFWLAEALYRTGEYQAALREYRSVLSSPSSAQSEQATWGSAWAQMKSGDYEGAIGTFSDFIRLYPSNRLVPEARLRIGDCYFSMKDFDRAAGRYLEFTRLHPERQDIDYAQYQLGQSYYRAGKFQQAIQEFNALLKKYPASSLADDAQYAVGWVWFQTKEYLQAVIEFQRLVTNHPQSELVGRALYSIGDSYYNNKQYDAAAKAYLEVLNRFPNGEYVLDAATGAQYAYLALARQRDATTLVPRFLDEHPNAEAKEVLLLRQGSFLMELRDFALAQSLYEQFLKDFPNSTRRASAFEGLGAALKSRGMYDRAASAYERSGTSSSYLLAALLYIEAKQTDRGMALLRRIQESDPRSAEAAEAGYQIGLLLESVGQRESAVKEFEKVRGGFPASTAADKSGIRLARLRSAFGDYHEALDILTPILSRRNDEIGAEAQFLRGVFLVQLGRHEDAETAFLRVRILFGSFEKWTALSLLELGNIYLSRGHVEKAREAFNSVTRIKGQPDAANEAKRRLTMLER